MNLNYRWIRFFYDEERQTIVAADDALIQLDSCGKEVLRCCNQLMDIADEAYPLVLQALYA